MPTLRATMASFFPGAIGTAIRLGAATISVTTTTGGCRRIRFSSLVGEVTPITGAPDPVLAFSAARIRLRYFASHERVCLRCFTTAEAFLETFERCRAALKRHPQRRALGLHQELIDRSKLRVEPAVRKSEAYSFRFRRGFGLHGPRACSETNGIGFASIKLPLLRLEDRRKPILSAHEGYSRLAIGTAHRAALQFICLVDRSDCPGARGDCLVVWRPRLHERGPRGEPRSATRDFRRRRRRFTHIPLANAGSPVPFENVEMDMIVVIAVSAGSQHRRKPMTGGIPHIITKRL